MFSEKFLLEQFLFSIVLNFAGSNIPFEDGVTLLLSTTKFDLLEVVTLKNKDKTSYKAICVNLLSGDTVGSTNIVLGRIGIN